MAFVAFAALASVVGIYLVQAVLPAPPERTVLYPPRERVVSLAVPDGLAVPDRAVPDRAVPVRLAGAAPRAPAEVHPAPAKILPGVSPIGTRGETAEGTSTVQIHDDDDTFLTLDEALEVARTADPAPTLPVAAPQHVALVPALWASAADDPRGQVRLRAADAALLSGISESEASWLSERARPSTAAPRVNGNGEDQVYLPVRVSATSHSHARQRLSRGQLPAPETVRVEEFLNALRYEDPPPDDGRPVAVTLEAASHPWEPDHHLLRLGLRGGTASPIDRPPIHLTILVDSSGSMAMDGRTELVRSAVLAMQGALTARDRIAILSYAGEAIPLLLPVAGDEEGAVARALGTLKPDGSSAMVEGLQLAYDVAAVSVEPDSIDQIILFSDGDANAGEAVLGPQVLEALVTRGRQAGVGLSAVSVGTAGATPRAMEALAARGGGEHFRVDTHDEARRLVDLVGATAPAAEAATVQVHIDPDAVARWRLFGFGPGGSSVRPMQLLAGQTLTALFDLVLQPGLSLMGSAAATVHVRASLPGSGEQQWSFRLARRKLRREFARASGDLRMTFAAATFAETLKSASGSEAVARHRQTAELIAQSLRRGHPEDSELLAMVRKAMHLAGRARIDASHARVAPVVQRYAGQVQYCYANALEHRPTTAGELQLELKVYGGEVVDVLVAENSTGDPALEACAVRKLRRWTFHAELDADVVLPFSLRPPAPAGGGQGALEAGAG